MDSNTAAVITTGLLTGTTFLIAAMFMWTRRLKARDRETMAAAPPLAALEERLERIEQAVESIAVEVERIGEGQRFITRVLSEQKQPALAEPARSGVEVRSRPNG